MAMKVYMAAGCLAVAGVALAAIDYVRRGDTVKVEPQGKPAPKGAGQTPSGPSTKNEPTKNEPTKGEPAKGTPVAEPVKPSSDPKPQPQANTAAGAKIIENLDPATLETKIGLDQAWTLHSSGIQFIDGRKAEDFTAGHVPGAVNIRAQDIQSGGETWRTFYTSADPAAWYVVYCDGGDCHESEQIRAFLIQAGFKSVLIFEKGFPGWMEAKLPTEKS